MFSKLKNPSRDIKQISQTKKSHGNRDDLFCRVNSIFSCCDFFLKKSYTIMSLYDDDDIDFAPEPKEDVKAQSEVVLKDEGSELIISDYFLNILEKTVPATNLSFLKAQLESKRAQIQFKVVSLN
jgi:hypothetical protein